MQKVLRSVYHPKRGYMHTVTYKDTYKFLKHNQICKISNFE